MIDRNPDRYYPSLVPIGPGINYESVCGRLAIRRPKIGEELFGAAIPQR